jgi:hypothetical protein
VVRGFFPLDERLAVAGESWSQGLKRVGTWLAVRTGSYQSAVEGLAESLGVKVNKTSLWRVVQEKGVEVKERLQEEAEAQWHMPPCGVVVKGQARLNQKMGIALDGVYINVIGEGWKEVKMGAVFEIAPLTEPEKQRRRHQGLSAQPADEIREMVKAQAISYCAVLGSVDEFEPIQWAEACRRQLPSCWDTVVIGDGAEWIDRIYQQCYPDSIRVVDWYHACEHLASLAPAAFGEGSQKGQHWLKNRKDELWRGEVHEVGAAITQLPLNPTDKDREANYFRKHARAMTYLEFCEMGLPVGSGVVEGGGCKGVVEGRLKRVGMRWSRTGAENMLALCCEYSSGRWKQIWVA